jgi:hypothetical protein
VTSPEVHNRATGADIPKAEKDFQAKIAAG